MFHRVLIGGFLAFLVVTVVSGQSAQSPTSAPGGATVDKTNAAAPRAVLDKYCVSCHNARLKTGGLALDQLDLSRLGEHAEVAEKVALKLRAGLMPPPNAPRPDQSTRDGLITWMERELDSHAVTSLAAPGIHRLNRTEYQNVIRDLIGLKIDAARFLPSDNSTRGFDNIAGALTMSPALMEAYLSAAGKISRLAMASNTAPTFVEFNVPDDATQNYHVQGLPFGTRGGTLIEHEFPADGEYVFRIVPVFEGNMGQANDPFGQILGERLAVTIDGQQVKLFDWDKEIRGTPRSGVPTPADSGEGRPAQDRRHVPREQLRTRQQHQRRLSARDDRDRRHSRVSVLSARGEGANRGTVERQSRLRHAEPPQDFCLPACEWLEASPGGGPASAKASAGSRRSSPAITASEDGCARRILSTLARRAFRRPVTSADVGVLMEFYSSGRRDGTFDDGIEKALRRLLADPEFVYRREVAPATVPAGRAYRISDLALASRLSFFLWSSMPDDELLTLAEQGRLREPATLEKQVRRMVADPKSAELIENFAGQWLDLRALATITPNPSVYPDFDDNLRQAFRREVELLFDSIVREDRSVLELLTADYTFVDERLARHYGIPNVYGSRFRRVTLGADLDVRRGLLGKGALLSVTSQATRTSPVTRGKRFLEVFLGVSPPSPPPVVPPLKPPQQDNAGNAREPTMRERMEMHLVNPSVCELSQLVRAHRPRARELRRDWRVAAQGRRPADRSHRRARKRDED